MPLVEMSTQQAPSEERVVSSFPDPPPSLYKVYTDDNVRDGLAPKPPVPIKGKYHMFGHLFDTEDAMIRPLEEQGLERLYPHSYDRKAELKKLNRSILICFLELLDVLINNPASPAREQKIKDISVLFINMHHLINEFRPHQARETLCVIMERQRKQREEMIRQVQRATEKSHSILKECSDSLGQAVRGLPSSDTATRAAVSTADESMDTMPSTMKVAGASSGTKTDSSSAAIVNTQDMELCSLIDQLIGT